MYYKIKVGSVTNAQRGAGVLRANGYKPNVGRLENPGPNDGCGFVINVNDEKNMVLDLLKKYGIRVLGVDSE